MTARWPHGDPRAIARAVLADPRYHVSVHGPGPKSWWQLLWEAVRSLWGRVFGPLGRLAGNDMVSTIVGVAVLLAAIGLLVYVVVRFGRGSTRVRSRVGADGAATALESEANAQALRVRALAALAEHRYHDAAALLWLSALRALDERGRVRYDASRTPGEWRRIVRDPAFDLLARDAVVAFFGERGVDAELVARMRSAYDRIVPT